ncbi:sugar ABC transporter substrate-binding protein [Marinobacter halodurans]|uniref:Sugar ABC transporter substrate-binding protein n=1 Tax=Marinobacter halodurans TaxID=2528979 RepID=A0ABY1ZSQ5_9GAMM|nr:substrate-binding domain-containing protein [Marinobacter halodurans]TBW58100.1 sugar ABC transporter substrate-binding protein [Marinobacter halodurans]
MKRLLAIGMLGLMITLTAAADDRLRIGVSVADLGNAFFYSLAEAIQAEAEAQSGRPVAMTVVSSAYDLKRQRRQIRQFIDDRVAIILLTAADSEAIEPDIRLAQKAGIVVAAIDIDARGADITVTTDNVQAGEIACQYLVDRLNHRGEVAVVNGAQVSSVTERVAGCRSVLNNYPDIHLVGDQYNGGGTFGGGLEAGTFLLSQQPAVQGIFAINDPSALGAAQAAELSGRDDIQIVSVDGSPAFIRAMREHQPNLAATAAQSPARMAKLAVARSLARMAHPGEPPQTIRIPTHLIDPGTLAASEGEVDQRY